jgi:2'-5' RNA ligase
MHDEDMASEAGEFWGRRHDLGPSSAGESDDERSRQPVLLAEVTGPEERPAYEQILDALADFDCVTPSAFGTLHLTVKLFDVSVGTSRIDRPAVDRIDEAVSSAVADVDPFAVEFPRFNVFPDVVYAEVRDGGRLGELNRQLCSHPAVGTLDRDVEGFIPHLTVGYFTGDSDYDALVGFLESNRALALPTLAVDELVLVDYEVGHRFPPTCDRLKTYQL